MAWKELRVIGPPGTGKTTYVASQVGKAVEVVGPEKVMVASLTRAAAAEAAGRDLPIPRGNVGTLHAFAYRSLGHPEIADVREGLRLWNRYCEDARVPYQMSVTGQDLEDAAVEGRAASDSAGDDVYAEISVLRAHMIPPEKWPGPAQRFWKHWQRFKDETVRFDFTDLIEFALNGADRAPGSPEVLFVDEAQDLDPLEFALARKWGAAAGTLVVVGDADQCLYEWRGSDPSKLSDPPVPEAHRRVLEQSYRVPAAVHAEAVRWIGRIPDREPIGYRPRDELGDVLHRPALTWKRGPEAIADAAVREVDAGRTVMVLTTCAYMLEPLKAILRGSGVPFHNPYRVKRGDWNPLRSAGQGKMVAKDRLLAFLRPDPRVWGDDARMWIPEDLRLWTEWLTSKGVLKHGAKKEIDALRGGVREEVDMLQLANWLEEDALSKALDLNVQWLLDKTQEAHRHKLQYPATILRRHGVGALVDDPKLIIGTIHSVKGGEADSVFLLPDLSHAGAMDMEYQAGENAITRQFYVGMTRARERLFLCGAEKRNLAVSWT